MRPKTHSKQFLSKHNSDQPSSMIFQTEAFYEFAFLIDTVKKIYHQLAKSIYKNYSALYPKLSLIKCFMLKYSEHQSFIG